MNHHSLVSNLKRIPHLRLPIEFDPYRMFMEIRDLDLVGYELPEGHDPDKREHYRAHWRGLGLVDFTTDSRLGMTDARSFRGEDGEVSMRYTQDGIPLTYYTDLANECPYLMEVIHTLTDTPDRCRVAAVEPGGTITWHSHCRFLSGNYDPLPYETAILHVPIWTNPDAKFGVTRWPHQRHGVNPHWQHYGPGEVWMLNSWHEHTACNTGRDTRYHLMIYAPIRGELEVMLQDAVTGYLNSPVPYPLMPED